MKLNVCFEGKNGSEMAPIRCSRKDFFSNMISILQSCRNPLYQIPKAIPTSELIRQSGANEHDDDVDNGVQLKSSNLVLLLP